jgi:hypothetical protein
MNQIEVGAAIFLFRHHVQATDVDRKVEGADAGSPKDRASVASPIMKRAW